MMFKETPKSKGDNDKEMLAGIERDDHSDDETPDVTAKVKPIHKTYSVPFSQSETDLLGNKASLDLLT